MKKRSSQKLAGIYTVLVSAVNPISSIHLGLNVNRRGPDRSQHLTRKFHPFLEPPSPKPFQSQFLVQISIKLSFLVSAQVIPLNHTYSNITPTKPCTGTINRSVSFFCLCQKPWWLRLSLLRGYRRSGGAALPRTQNHKP